MPSTFTTNLGIQKPADGEQSGAWGATVNVNSNILDRAISGSLSLTLSGTSSTLTTLQGSVSNGQFKVLELIGTPSGTHTITIDPATAQTLYHVNNTTAQSVIFTQGSGGNATIVAGTSATIYSSGAGASAKVTDITQLDNKIPKNADAALTGGYTTTADADGTFSSGTYTPVPSGGNMKSITNGGAFTLAAPSATGDYTLIIRMVNNASAGTVTLSGFTKSGGDTLTTTNGNAFFLYITKCAGSVALIVQALQ